MTDDWTVEAYTGTSYANSRMEYYSVPPDSIVTYSPEKPEVPPDRMTLAWIPYIWPGRSLPPSRNSPGSSSTDTRPLPPHKVDSEALQPSEAAGSTTSTLLPAIQLPDTPSDSPHAPYTPSGRARAAEMKAIHILTRPRNVKTKVNSPGTIDAKALARSGWEVCSYPLLTPIPP